MNNVINKRPSLEDLIWKGSVLPNKYKFAVRNDIRAELQKLDERWTKLKTIYNDLVDLTSRLHADWVTCETSLNDLQIWIDGIFDAISKEGELKYRNGQKLNDFLSHFKVISPIKTFNL